MSVSQTSWRFLVDDEARAAVAGGADFWGGIERRAVHTVMLTPAREQQAIIGGAWRTAIFQKPPRVLATLIEEGPEVVAASVVLDQQSQTVFVAAYMPLDRRFLRMDAFAAPLRGILDPETQGQLGEAGVFGGLFGSPLTPLEQLDGVAAESREAFAELLRSNGFNALFAQIERDEIQKGLSLVSAGDEMAGSSDSGPSADRAARRI